MSFQRSPFLILLVMDPLLSSLENRGLGPSISNTYIAGAHTHADNICTATLYIALWLPYNSKLMQCRPSLLTTHCSWYLTQPNVKFLQCCHPNLYPQHPLVSWEIRSSSHNIIQNVLGTGGLWDLLSATRANDKAIKKARKALFATGVTGPFHGKLNPISGKTLSDTCVIPILLYGRENWILPHY